MNLVNQLLNSVSGYFNPSTLSGAIDVLVIQQPDGSLRGSPFHARFGKRGVLRPRDNAVDLYINEQPINGLFAKLGPAGAVYFSTEPPPPPPTPALACGLFFRFDDDSGGCFNKSKATSPTVTVEQAVGDTEFDTGQDHTLCVAGPTADSVDKVDWRWGQLPEKTAPQELAPPASLSTPSSPTSSWTSLLSLLDGAKQQLAGRTERSIRLSSDQLQLLGLRPGRNRLRYEITTKYQGTASCSCAVYLWRHDDRLVVSDIDGTITRSDLLGHLLPIVGKDWTQPMVVRLFSAVRRNGYRFVYLSSRGLGQSEATRRFLKQISQEGAALPDGPVLLSPESLLRALHREVIAGKPQEFKIPCLQDVRDLFPPPAAASSSPKGDSAHGVPFWAGFGNRPTDAVTYAQVGVPAALCFIVNSRGELLPDSVGQDDSCAAAGIASYKALAEMVDQVFPAWAGTVDEEDEEPEGRTADSPEPEQLLQPPPPGGAEKGSRRRSSGTLLTGWLSDSNLYLQ